MTCKFFICILLLAVTPLTHHLIDDASGLISNLSFNVGSALPSVASKKSTVVGFDERMLLHAEVWYIILIFVSKPNFEGKSYAFIYWILLFNFLFVLVKITFR